MPSTRHMLWDNIRRIKERDRSIDDHMTSLSWQIIKPLNSWKLEKQHPISKRGSDRVRSSANSGKVADLLTTPALGSLGGALGAVVRGSAAPVAAAGQGLAASCS